MKAVLINATNVHYGKVASALWLPGGDGGAGTQTIRDKMDKVSVRQKVRIWQSLGVAAETIADDLLKSFPQLFIPEERSGIVLVLKPKVDEAAPVLTIEDENEMQIRIPEYRELQLPHTRQRTGEHLEIRKVDLSGTAGWFREKIAGLHQVDRLRETRVQYGFSRLLPQKPAGSPSYQSQMWRNMPHSIEQRWLPAAVVFGEGIFLRFDEDRLKTWEDEINAARYLDELQIRADTAADVAQRPRVKVTPRLIMLHTFAHLLIRRLAFECGYSASSLRERLYVNRDPAKPEEHMAGVLIYTASGDCEGSLGGLVRMGEPARFQKIVEGAIKDAEWCSSDPVCTEIGQDGGQGTDGLNLAACHCCALIAETSCEQFNRFLDRGLVAGTPKAPKLGFFSQR